MECWLKCLQEAGIMGKQADGTIRAKCCRSKSRPGRLSQYSVAQHPKAEFKKLVVVHRSGMAARIDEQSIKRQRAPLGRLGSAVQK